MFKKTEDTPVIPMLKNLSHIVVKWRHPSQNEETHVLYDALQIGETVARQRAASKVATVLAAGSSVTRYRAYFMDCSIEDLPA